MLPRLMIREDPEISAMVMDRFRAEGVDVLVNHKALRFAVENGEKVLYAETEGREVRIAFDALLCAVGRVATPPAMASRSSASRPPGLERWK